MNVLLRSAPTPIQVISCVLMAHSQAQHGLFIIGNTNIAERVPMWSEVIRMLRITDSVGTTMSLCCPRHPSVRMEVSRPEIGNIITLFLSDPELLGL
jgi:hypothetical protein